MLLLPINTYRVCPNDGTLTAFARYTKAFRILSFIIISKYSIQYSREASTPSLPSPAPGLHPWSGQQQLQGSIDHSQLLGVIYRLHFCSDILPSTVKIYVVFVDGPAGSTRPNFVDKMMSVNELFYGNQPAPTWILSTTAAQVKHYAPSYYGNYSYPHESALRHDHDMPYSYNNNYYDPSMDSYSSGSRSHDSQRYGYASNNNPASNYHSSSRQYDNSAGTRTLTHDRPQNAREYSSNYNYSTGGGISKGPASRVELKVPLCCEACEERVTSRLFKLRGVESVQCDQFKQKVVVRGNAAPADILRVCRKLFKRSEFWQY